MKAIYFIAAAVLTLASCSGNKKTADSTDATVGETGECTYVGVLPAADAAGVRYSLALTYDSMDGGKSGNYALVETYLVADSLATEGFEDGKVFNTEGEFTVMTGTPASATQKYLKLVPSKSPEATEAVTDAMYFVVDTDSTLTMVNSSLEPSVTPELNYTLTLLR